VGETTLLITEEIGEISSLGASSGRRMRLERPIWLRSTVLSEQKLYQLFNHQD